MDKLVSLLKIDLINSLNLAKIKDKKNKKRLAFFGILLLFMLPNYIFLIRGLDSSFQIYKEMGREADFLKQAVINVQLISLIFGVPYILNKYYYSRDIDYLVPLPIKSSHIIGSKFIMIIIYNYIIALPFFIPYLYIYGKNMSEGLVYIIYGLINLLMIAVFPVALISIFVMLMMKYTNISNKKDLLRTLFSIFFILAMLMLQFKIQDLISSESQAGGDALKSLVLATSNIMDRIGLIFPMSIFASRALANSKSLVGLGNMILFIVGNLFAYLLALKIAERVYISGYTSVGEIQSRKSKTISEMSREVKRRSKYIAIMQKELILIIKTPLYLLNMLGGMIIIPILYIFILSSEKELMNNTLTIYSENKVLFLIYASLAVGFLNINSSAVTSFSREGKSMWIHRTLPIDEKTQIIGRLLAALALVLLANIIVNGVLVYMIGIKLLDIIFVLIMSSIISLPIILYAMLIDISNPVLDWDNPQRAVKQNVNVVISMISITFYLLILVFISYMFRSNYKALLWTILAISILSSYSLQKSLKSKINYQMVNL